MKNFKIFSVLILLAMTAMISSSCGKSRTTGDINVNLSVLAGHTVDMTGIKVQLHGMSTFDLMLFSQDATGSPTSASALFEELEPGKYYVCAWSDKDSDLQYSAGDLFGFYPYPVNLVEKDELEIGIEVYLLD